MFNLKKEKRYVKTTLAITLTLFFLTCVFCIVKYGLKFGEDTHTLLGNFYNPNNDDVKFIRSAIILAETGNYVYHKLPNPTVFMMPGLPFTLAFFIRVFGSFGGITAFRVFQVILQTSSLFILFLIGRKFFSSKVAVVAVIINALYIPEVWISNLILTETIFKFFVLSLVYFSLLAIEENKIKYYIIGGVLWGVATLFRPTIATFPIVILLMWRLKRYTFKEIIKYTTVVTLIFCVVLSPWWIRNYKVFNRFIPLTLATGNPMLQGTFINYDQESMQKDGLDYSQFRYPRNDEIENNQVEIAILKYRLKNLAPRQPLQFLYWYTIGKTITHIYLPMYWREILGVNIKIAVVYHYIILIFGLLGIIKYFKDKDRNRLGTLAFLTIIYFIVVYLPFYAFSRYFYPAIPLLILFTAKYAVEQIPWLRKI